jgi:hypothetical protein
VQEYLGVIAENRLVPEAEETNVIEERGHGADGFVA